MHNTENTATPPKNSKPDSKAKGAKALKNVKIDLTNHNTIVDLVFGANVKGPVDMDRPFASHLLEQTAIATNAVNRLNHIAKIYGI